MPRIKWQLTGPEKNEYRDRAEWLRGAGTAIEVPQERSERCNPVLVSQYGPEFNDIVINLHPGRVVLVVGLRLLAVRSGIRLGDCQVEPPWKGSNFFLPSVSEDRDYRFTGGLEFSRNEVFNHRIHEGMFLRRGTPVDGVLIATEFAPLPKDLRHGTPVQFGLIFLDQFGDEFSSEIEVRVNRRIGAMSSVARPVERRGLFDSDHVEVPGIVADRTSNRVRRQAFSAIADRSKRDRHANGESFVDSGLNAMNRSCIIGDRCATKTPHRIGEAHPCSERKHFF